MATPVKFAVAIVCLYLFNSLASSQQENSDNVKCSPAPPSSGTLLGFTALSPDQLKTEIRLSVQETLSELREEERILTAVNTVQETLEGVNLSLSQLQERLVHTMQDSLEQYVDRVLAEAVRNLTLTFQTALSSVNISPPSSTPPASSATPPPPSSSPATTPQPSSSPSTTTLPPPPPLPPGLSPSNPADSCQDVLQRLPTAPNGNYWLHSPSATGAVSVYCHMTQTCGNLTGGWMRAAYVNMSDPAHHCPGSFVEMNRDVGRLCVADSAGSGCFSHTFPVVGPEYSQVCGRVVAYQESTPNGFFAFHINPSLTIDDVYMDGISLTHGEPRQHVWSFVAALDETGTHLSACRCSNLHNIDNGATVPPFIGEHYFCDTGSRGTVSFQFYEEDPLWDGSGCGQSSSCCSYNDPPWFLRQLSSPTADGLEMRVCRDAAATNENTPFQVVELYVR